MLRASGDERHRTTGRHHLDPVFESLGGAGPHASMGLFSPSCSPPQQRRLHRHKKVEPEQATVCTACAGMNLVALSREALSIRCSPNARGCTDSRLRPRVGRSLRPARAGVNPSQLHMADLPCRDGPRRAARWMVRHQSPTRCRGAQLIGERPATAVDGQWQSDERQYAKVSHHAAAMMSRGEQASVEHPDRSPRTRGDRQARRLRDQAWSASEW